MDPMATGLAYCGIQLLGAFMAGLSLAAYRGVRQPPPDLEPTGSLGHGGSYWEWLLEMV